LGDALAGPAWQVACVSGWSYAERPAALLRAGVRLEVERIEQMWRSPQGRHFVVRIQDERSVALLYNEVEDCWTVEFI
jgi:hypothetical protein